MEEKIVLQLRKLVLNLNKIVILILILVYIRYALHDIMEINETIFESKFIIIELIIIMCFVNQTVKLGQLVILIFNVDFLFNKKWLFYILNFRYHNWIFFKIFNWFWLFSFLLLLFLLLVFKYLLEVLDVSWLLRLYLTSIDANHFGTCIVLFWGFVLSFH